MNYWNWNREKRYLVLLRNIHGTWNIEKIIRIKNFAADSYKLSKDKEYPLNQGRPHHAKGLNKFYYHDIVTTSPITLDVQEPVISPEQLANINNDKQLKTLLRGVGEKKIHLQEYILGGLIGGFGTGFIMLIIAIAMGII